MGFDPSRPDIHLGHTVGLRKLRQLQDMGHQVVLIVGDWTAQIGDPSGQSLTRPMLTRQEVLDNAQSYMRQFFKVVDRDRTEVQWQSAWYGAFTLEDVLRLTSKFTVAQFLQREDFWKRWEAKRPIAITELLYPLLQAYDSVAVRSDVEFGGTDQKFNLLVGRELQGMMGQRPQHIVTVPILVGLDGVQKMSKSLGNYIALEEPARDMFGKVMSLADNVILDYYTLLTDVPDAEIAEMRGQLAGGANPMDLKKRLGHIIVSEFHDRGAADDAQGYFESVVQGRSIPDDALTVTGSQISNALSRAASGEGLVANLPALLTAAGLAKSAGEAKRLIAQGSVDVDGERAAGLTHGVKEGSILKVGKRRWARLVELPQL
jgi:tyrosyl-tRNA synthetase